MFEVSVSDKFTAAHQLRGPDGPTEPLHEHEWNVTVACAGETLDELGLLLDFTTLRARLRQLLAEFDGQSLNELQTFAERNPSAENVARYVFECLALGLPANVALTSVAVEEEPGCIARYTRE